MKKILLVAMRGRKLNGSEHYTQQIEANPYGICNTITSVEKDNLVLEYEDD